MVQQKADSKFSEYGLGSTETNLPTHDKQFPVAVKKTPLKDLQNDNRITVAGLVGNPALLKDRGPIVDNVKVSSSKRSSYKCPVSPPFPQPAASNVASGQLVYARRKPEAELGKSNACDALSNDAYCPHAKLFGNQEVTILPRIHVKEPNFACFPAVAPSPVATLMSSSGKLSVSVPLGNSNMISAIAESNYKSVASAIVSLGNPKSTKNLHWEERYQQMQLYLKKLDQSDQEDYVQTLRSISSVELSRLALELEKRSIQLSLEEAKVVQRAAVLNVLGKSTKK
ncbi:hypothetical protein HS088_TW07G01404 [Tripterygium wilfordii]|uniref:Uncharacterized protein n=1 Tax=Tripterygium wilfordii TaxID=458696 RepID=A0A7J7DHH7_TRIWF|nr:uncharacterized protein LOC120001763 isoform X2 [Tripterygium wilfordii]KAF5745810.1 hypothetical protein HS088_TW07G01404 [Tripterygium wilfordii]